MLVSGSSQFCNWLLGNLPGLAEISHEWLEAWQLGCLWTAPQEFPKKWKTQPLIGGDQELRNKGRKKSANSMASFFLCFWLGICWRMRYLEAPANLVSASPAVGSNSRVNHGGVQVRNHRKREIFRRRTLPKWPGIQIFAFWWNIYTVSLDPP